MPDVEMFSLQSMLRGGDRKWRAAMQLIGHEAAADAACDVAGLAFDAYCSKQDANDQVYRLASEAIQALKEWKRIVHSPEANSALNEVANRFFLAVAVGGEFFTASGFRARALGHIIGLCSSVVLAPANPRYVRWLGEAVDQTHRLLNVEESSLKQTISSATLPYVRNRVGGVAGECQPGIPGRPRSH